MADTIKPRVFVSSVMTAFTEYRAAAREGVRDAGGTPVLIEDVPSVDASSRTACLDLVKSSDVYALIIGDRPGSSPLGRPVVEEEFEEARRRKIPRLVFIQDVQRDEATNALLQRVSDYVHGRFRTTFRTPTDLRSVMSAALHDMISGSVNAERNTPNSVEALLPTNRSTSVAPTLHLALIPERNDEVFDVLQFDDEDFRRNLFELAHRKDVSLFTFEGGAKTATVTANTIVLTELQHHGAPDITIRVREDGAVTIDQALTRRGSKYGVGELQIPEQAVAAALSAGFAFLNALYESIDPGHRYATFFYAAGLSGMSVHVIVSELRERKSFTLPMNDREYFLLEKPRKLDRTDLADPKQIVTRLLALIRKRYGEQT